VGWAQPAMVWVPCHSITSSGKTDIIRQVTSLDNVERRRTQVASKASTAEAMLRARMPARRTAGVGSSGVSISRLSTSPFRFCMMDPSTLRMRFGSAPVLSSKNPLRRV
jgi:hypothetical protein